MSIYATTRVIDQIAHESLCHRIVDQLTQLQDAPFGKAYGRDIRRAKRQIITDWHHVTEFVFDQLHFKGFHCDAYSPVWRAYRYDVDDYFKMHRDGASSTPGGMSTHTLLLYLNNDFEGGKTVLYEDDDNGRKMTVWPEPGRCLIFPHARLHESTTVVSGSKYVMRTDLLIKPE